jgi:hypothetical protein
VRLSLDSDDSSDRWHRFEWLDDKLWKDGKERDEGHDVDYDAVIGSPQSRSGRATPERRRSSGALPTRRGLEMGKTSALEDSSVLQQRYTTGGEL